MMRVSKYKEYEMKESEVLEKWFDRGVEAGQTDTWMDCENTIKEVYEGNADATAALDLVQLDQDGWEQTCHYEMLYGQPMAEDAREFATDDYPGFYLDCVNSFWDGFLQGKLSKGVNLIEIARELILSSN